ncbi:UPF0496 protein At2g18630-like [Corylus avellana]|uniref:UPF0496 protein At2g18630-like n=1 Tax=Corylus avellana TaxID=13451 RepID=UPI001E215956|nr:UPF0496 protein At2g18630-like [Corylus avellana]XP_059456364.1 UPF0496 protein At2g18630-like [Corylus avellana]XP_059458644.1 UPF0496 protein At2g18630-like [Corylus avellana]XP_059458645.1 UPF0496 protein At2g18630-like [Corylus avellana]
MGGICSKNQFSEFTADMSCYEVACALEEHTNCVISSFAAGVNEPGSVSFDAIREINKCLLEMHQDGANFNLKCKEDIWRNQELFSFVEDYFANSLKTLEFCIALENCLKHTRDKQLKIKLAVEHFEKEVEDGVDGVKHVKTLEELRKYKAAGDPFTEEFFVLFKSVYEQHELMWKKLQVRKSELDKKLKSIKTFSRVLNVIFAAALVYVLVFSVVAATIAIPPPVVALIGALTARLDSAVKWCSSLWTPYEDDLKRRREVIRAMKGGTRITITDLSNIEALANKLDIEIKSILYFADFALREEDALKLAIDEIKKLDVFMRTIHQLSEAADRCGQDIRHERTIVLRTMFSRENI